MKSFIFNFILLLFLTGCSKNPITTNSKNDSWRYFSYTSGYGDPYDQSPVSQLTAVFQTENGPQTQIIPTNTYWFSPTVNLQKNQLSVTVIGIGSYNNSYINGGIQDMSNYAMTKTNHMVEGIGPITWTFNSSDF